jgi:hypothetical protein
MAAWCSPGWKAGQPRCQRKQRLGTRLYRGLPHAAVDCRRHRGGAVARAGQPKTLRRTGWPFGVVSFQLIGVKNISAPKALAKHGEDLFIKENDKKDLGKEKIDEKIFEIERRLLIRKRR